MLELFNCFVDCVDELLLFDVCVVFCVGCCFVDVDFVFRFVFGCDVVVFVGWKKLVGCAVFFAACVVVRMWCFQKVFLLVDNLLSEGGREMQLGKPINNNPSFGLFVTHACWVSVFLVLCYGLICFPVLVRTLDTASRGVQSVFVDFQCFSVLCVCCVWFSIFRPRTCG